MPICTLTVLALREHARDNSWSTSKYPTGHLSTKKTSHPIEASATKRDSKEAWAIMAQIRGIYCLFAW
jgi:hypothetical protein